MGFFNSKETVTQKMDAPAFVQNQTQATMQRANQYRPAVERPQVAQLNQDQTAFFDTARNYAQQAMNRDTPEIDTSALENMLGRRVDTGQLTGLIGQRANLGGVLGMVGRQADTSGIRNAAAQTVDSGELGALMGQDNVARGIFEQFTNRETTPFLQAQIKDATDRALQNELSKYAGAGRTGSTAFADAAARGVTAASAPILQAQANADAARQLQAAGMLGQAAAQDRSMDASLAGQRAAIDAANVNRNLQGLGMISSIEQAALNRDLAANQFAAQMENTGFARDANLAQQAAALQAGDFARDASLAGQLTNASQQQAMLAPTMQQMDLQAMNLFGQIGAQQQAQRQAELNAQQQYIQMLNDAQQQQYNNLVVSSQLGQPFIGNTSTTEGNLMNTVAGIAATGLGTYLGAGGTFGAGGGGG